MTKKVLLLNIQSHQRLQQNSSALLNIWLHAVMGVAMIKTTLLPPVYFATGYAIA
jgi:hypothetical protein